MHHNNDTPLYSLAIAEFKQLLQDEAVLSKAKNGIDRSSEHDPNKLLSITEASLLLQISKNTLYAMNSQKRIPFIKAKGSGKVYYKKSTLMEWLDKGEQPTCDHQNNQAVGGAKLCK